MSKEKQSVTTIHMKDGSIEILKGDVGMQLIKGFFVFDTIEEDEYDVMHLLTINKKLVKKIKSTIE